MYIQRNENLKEIAKIVFITDVPAKTTKGMNEHNSKFWVTRYMSSILLSSNILTFLDA